MKSRNFEKVEKVGNNHYKTNVQKRNCSKIFTLMLIKTRLIDLFNNFIFTSKLMC